MPTGCAAPACHRSLIVRRLAERFGFQVEHLRPGGSGPGSAPEPA
jgi:hypothetical protein